MSAPVTPRAAAAEPLLAAGQRENVKATLPEFLQAAWKSYMFRLFPMLVLWIAGVL